MNRTIVPDDAPFVLDTAEIERYELRAGSQYRFEPDRREFVSLFGAGLLIVSVATDVEAQRPGARGPRRSERLSERFHFGEDGFVTAFTSKVEAGQGSRTQITQAVAEELRMPPDRIRLVMADTQRCPDDGGTAGSRTTPSTVPRVRSAAVAARELLIKFAAERLGVSEDQVAMDGGAFRAGADKQLSLAALAADPKLRSQLEVISVGDGVDPVAVDKWKVLGESVPKVNGRAVVTGASIFPADVIRPKMLYGRIVRPIAYQAELISIDLQPAQQMDGVVVVRDGSFIGCAAPTTWLAGKACDAIATTAQWRTVPHPSSQELFDHLKRTAKEGRSGRGGRGAWGDLEKANASAHARINSQYKVAYIQHAPMEPRVAVAEWDGGQLTVWTGSQQPARVQSELAQTFRLASDRVRVIVPDTGGGFGGKHSGEVAVEAARLAKAASRPVQVRWTREEEFTWAYFRPAGLIEVHGAIDSRGNLLAWDFANYNSGSSAIDTPYQIPNGRTQFIETDSPLRQGSYRALASTANTFARESAMDELAALAGVDPLEFRLRHLVAGRLQDVLRAACAKFDWPERRASRQPARRGIGLACGSEKGSFVAACAEVEVGDEIKVLKVCQAYECGAIQNPQNLRAQVEGCLVMGLGGALWEEMEFENGKISNAAFSGYRVPRMNDVPELDLVLLDRRDLPSVGAGETPIIAIAPAIANAVHHATGKRLRSMPLRL